MAVGSLLRCLILSVVLVFAQGKSSMLSLKNVEQLDEEGRVFLAWEYDPQSTLINFEIEAETLGFVGLGISPQGNMFGADIFIAGVHPNGSAYSSDLYGIGIVPPKIDEHSDWTLIGAVEMPTLGKTYLKFSRLANTCDDEDYPIGNATTRLIWALGKTDEIQYHGGENRGARSVNLLGEPAPELDLQGVSNWQMTVDMVMPSVDTAYWCSFHKGPLLTEKHHIVAFDAFLDGLDAKKHTHHFILFNCHLPADHNQTLDEVFGNYTIDHHPGNHCYEPNQTIPGNLTKYCSEHLFVWAKGGKMMVFPENTGYPIGEGDSAGKHMYYMLEVHYDNPEEFENVKFNTGVQFYYTNETRQEDAGIMVVGQPTNILLTIPPNTTNFMAVGQCPSECTSWGIEKNDGITVFNTLLHAHMSGRKLKLRQIRGDKELPWIHSDDHYDFDYQQNSPIPLTKIMPGDTLIYECIYDSTWNGGKAVVGGLSSRDEMCLAYLWYYPRQKLDECMSSPSFDEHRNAFGITEFHEENIDGENTIVIDAPEYLKGPYKESINRFSNWTAEFIKQYQEDKTYRVQDAVCYNRVSFDFAIFNATYPTTIEEYIPEDICNLTTSPPPPPPPPPQDGSVSAVRYSLVLGTIMPVWVYIMS